MQRLDLNYRIGWRNRWHVGSGYQSIRADRLLRRLGGIDGSPFVPGSQIKGVLRHQCEQLAVALQLEAVSPHADTGEHNRDLVNHFSPLRMSDLVIDRLFGSRYQGECLFVTNAVPISTAARDVVSVDSRTAVDRVSGTAMDQHLFTTESATTDIILRGSIRARHFAGVLTQDCGGFPYEYALLVAGLLSLDRLGGDKSVGLGWCKIELERNSVRWNESDIPLLEVLQTFRNEDEWGVMLNLLREESDR